MGITVKNMGQLFLVRNPSMKFKHPSLIFLDGWTEGRVVGQA